MSSGIHVVERIEHESEAGKPFEIELFVFYVCMMGDKFNIGVELLGDILCDNSFGFLDMFAPEEELTIEIGEIDCVKVNYVNFAETSENEVFE